MIHIDYADGTSEWLTDEQLKEKHPELYAKLRQPEPYKEYGQRLKKIRQKNDYSIRELAKIVGLTGKEVCDIEQGRTEPPQRVIDFYGQLKHRSATE